MFSLNRLLSQNIHVNNFYCLFSCFSFDKVEPKIPVVWGKVSHFIYFFALTQRDILNMGKILITSFLIWHRNQIFPTSGSPKLTK